MPYKQKSGSEKIKKVKCNKFKRYRSKYSAINIQFYCENFMRK